jgi:proline utilization trans-activator
MYAGQSARLCNMLQLHQASTSSDCSPMEREHRKRVWWSTFCLDRLTSTQRGLLPTLDVKHTDLAYPTSVGLVAEDVGEFTDPDYLTARIQLTIIQANNSKSESLLGQDDGHNIQAILRPMLQRLTAWKEALPGHMIFGMEDDMSKSTRSLPCMRSLANLHLRYNQVCIKPFQELFLTTDFHSIFCQTSDK